jgi:hypothetical protein
LDDPNGAAGEGLQQAGHIRGNKPEEKSEDEEQQNDAPPQNAQRRYPHLRRLQRV